MGVLGLDVPVDPLPDKIGEYNKTPAATPEPKPKVAKPSAPTPEPEKVVAASSPQSGGDPNLQKIADLEQQILNRPPPKLPEIKERPKTGYDDIQLWGSLAIAFAALASARTRTPMTTALNAAAAALNGMHEGSNERFAQNYKEWQDQQKLAFQMYDFEQQQYQELIANTKSAAELGFRLHDEQAREAEMQWKNTMSILGDAQTYQAYEEGKKTGGIAGGIKAAADFQKAKDDQKQKLEEARLSASKYGDSILVQNAVQSDAEYKKAVAEGDTAKQLERIRYFQTQFGSPQASKWQLEQGRQTDEYKKALGSGDYMTMARIDAASGDPKAVSKYESIMERAGRKAAGQNAADARKTQHLTALQEEIMTALDYEDALGSSGASQMVEYYTDKLKGFASGDVEERATKAEQKLDELRASLGNALRGYAGGGTRTKSDLIAIDGMVGSIEKGSGKTEIVTGLKILGNYIARLNKDPDGIPFPELEKQTPMVPNSEGGGDKGSGSQDNPITTTSVDDAKNAPVGSYLYNPVTKKRVHKTGPDTYTAE